LWRSASLFLPPVISTGKIYHLSQKLELVTQALILLLENQAALCESSPTTGYINR
jgi:hypothetical protein